MTYPLHHPCPPPPAQWWASDNEEFYSVGPCATREEVITIKNGEGMA